MLAIDDNESVQMDENSDFNDANMIETEDAIDITVDVETEDVIAVSYTHLDVYKRQGLSRLYKWRT